MATEYYDASESSSHSDIETLHCRRDCHHLDGADYVFGITDAGDEINRCGTCCDSGSEPESTDSDGSGDDGSGSATDGDGGE